jgi:hypothetical protein
MVPIKISAPPGRLSTGKSPKVNKTLTQTESEREFQHILAYYGTGSRSRRFFLGLERLGRQAKNASFLAKNEDLTKETLGREC